MKKGFTLIELLIVIAIIGILSGAVLVNTGSARNKAKSAKAYTTMQSVFKAASACVISGGKISEPGFSANPGSSICEGGVEKYPDLTDAGMKYCGSGIPNCGGWMPVSGPFAISAWDSVSKIIVCGSDVNVDAGWFVGYHGAGGLDFTGKDGCVKIGF